MAKTLSKAERKALKKLKKSNAEILEGMTNLAVVPSPTPARKSASGAATRKAVPKNVRRLNSDVTERMKVQLISEARTVRDLTDRLDAARKRRNDTVRSLCDRGLSEREIGELAGMSGPRVNQIYFGTNGSRS